MQPAAAAQLSLLSRRRWRRAPTQILNAAHTGSWRNSRSGVANGTKLNLAGDDIIITFIIARRPTEWQWRKMARASEHKQKIKHYGLGSATKRPTTTRGEPRKRKPPPPPPVALAFKSGLRRRQQSIIQLQREILCAATGQHLAGSVRQQLVV